MCTQESNQADVDPVEAIPDIVEEPEEDNGPPQATVARRAKSFSDFYDVARAHIKKERDLEKQKLKKRSRDQLKTELDFGDWYNGISDELLDASHEEYQYALLTRAICCDMCLRAVISQVVPRSAPLVPPTPRFPAGEHIVRT